MACHQIPGDKITKVLKRTASPLVQFSCVSICLKVPHCSGDSRKIILSSLGLSPFLQRP